MDIAIVSARDTNRRCQVGVASSIIEYHLTCGRESDREVHVAVIGCVCGVPANRGHTADGVVNKDVVFGCTICTQIIPQSRDSYELCQFGRRVGKVAEAVVKRSEL